MAKSLFKMPDFDKFVAQTEAAKDKIDEIAAACVADARDIQYDAMMDGLARHRKTGASMAALTKTEVKQDGNRFTADIVLEGDAKNNMDGFWGAWMQEYGSPRFAKDPWMRPAIDNSKPRIKAAWMARFEKAGYPMK